MTQQADKRILCVGMICLDIVSVCEKYPEEDTDQRSLDNFWRRGGNASNSSTVLSLLGANAEVLGTMTRDQKAELEFLQSDLQQHGIISENCPLRGPPYRCPSALIILSKETGSRTILAALNYHEEVSFEDFDKLDLDKYKWIHFEGRRNGDVISEMMDKIIAHNSSRSDPITISLELEKKNRPQLNPLIGKVDYTFLSKDVAREKGYSTKEQAVMGLIQSCKQSASVVCAWGEDGAAGITTGASAVASKAFPPDTLVDTIGAGDTFNAGTIFALSEGNSLQEAITFGCRVAGAKCGVMGFKELKGMEKYL